MICGKMMNCVFLLPLLYLNKKACVCLNVVRYVRVSIRIKIVFEIKKNTDDGVIYPENYCKMGCILIRLVFSSMSSEQLDYLIFFIIFFLLKHQTISIWYDRNSSNKRFWSVCLCVYLHKIFQFSSWCVLSNNSWCNENFVECCRTVEQVIKAHCISGFSWKV